MEYREAKIKPETKKEKSTLDMIEEKKLCKVENGDLDNSIRVDKITTFVVRNCGAFRNKSVYLSGAFDWVIRKDEEGILCLIPLKKY